AGIAGIGQGGQSQQDVAGAMATAAPCSAVPSAAITVAVESVIGLGKQVRYKVVPRNSSESVERLVVALADDRFRLLTHTTLYSSFKEVDAGLHHPTLDAGSNHWIAFTGAIGGDYFVCRERLK